MLFGLGPLELLLLGVLIAVLFGVGRLSFAARELGRLHGLVQRIKREIGQLFRIF